VDRIANIAASIVAVAGLTVLVTNSNTARIIGAAGDAFSGSLRAAMGR